MGWREIYKSCSRKIIPVRILLDIHNARRRWLLTCTFSMMHAKFLRPIGKMKKRNADRYCETTARVYYFEYIDRDILLCIREFGACCLFFSGTHINTLTHTHVLHTVY